VLRAAAEEIGAAARAAVAQQGQFVVALSGGRTPRGLYALLAGDATIRTTIPWERTHVFWGDERHVPPDHPDSNYRMARETLLDHVPLPATNVHRVLGEDRDAERAAARYGQELRAFFGLEAAAPALTPAVGARPDGYTASLFWDRRAGGRRGSRSPPRRGRDRPHHADPARAEHAACVAFLVTGARRPTSCAPCRRRKRPAAAGAAV
jgi:6-phosphogluconolactonase